MFRFLAAAVLALTSVSHAKVYFEETFDNLDAWTQSSWKDDMGKFELSAGEWHADASENQGLLTTANMRHHAISAKLPEAFSNRDKDLIVQFTAKHEANEYSFCGGGYIKLLPSTTDLENFGGDSPYHIMFGPDRCGYEVSKIHAIFNDGKENLEKTSEIKLEYGDKNEFTHLYTLIVHPDNTYEVQFDGESKASGDMVKDWKFEQKTMADPKDKKPTDWVDEAKIPDPEDKKPEGYDDIAAQIPDPEAEKPEDWDEEDDGEWESPMIDNPEYQGEWKPKMIANPDYKGEWKAKRVANPDYREDVYAFDDIGAIGFELWIVNKGTIFDNIIVTDDVAEAKAHAAEHFEAFKDAEKKVKEDMDAAKKAEEEAAKKAAKDDEDDEDDEEGEHDEL